MQRLERIIAGLPYLVILQTGLAIVFILFGIAKFMEYEALGVADLIANHPLLKLGPEFFGAHYFSITLGVVELFTAALLIGGFVSARMGFWGGLLGAGAFAMTLSLMLTNAIWYQGQFGFLNTIGQFLAKDFGLLAACLAVAIINARKLR